MGLVQAAFLLISDDAYIAKTSSSCFDEYLVRDKLSEFHSPFFSLFSSEVYLTSAEGEPQQIRNRCSLEILETIQTGNALSFSIGITLLVSGFHRIVFAL